MLHTEMKCFVYICHRYVFDLVVRKIIVDNPNLMSYMSLHLLIKNVMTYYK